MERNENYRKYREKLVLAFGMALHYIFWSILQYTGIVTVLYSWPIILHDLEKCFSRLISNHDTSNYLVYSMGSITDARLWLHVIWNSRLWFSWFVNYDYDFDYDYSCMITIMITMIFTRFHCIIQYNFNLITNSLF